MKGNSNKRKHRGVKIVAIILGVLLVLAVSAGAVGYFYLNKIKNIKIDENAVSVSEIPDTIQNEEGKDIKRNDVTNILLLGVDKEENASDSIIVLSIDNTKKQIKMSSLLRDTYVFYGDNNVNKLNYAYNYGGEVNSVKVVNEQFKLDIKDYVKVDFGGLANIIDAIGGIEINVKANELPLLNSYAKSIAKITGTKYTPLSNSGHQKINGQQAVAYSRIRYVGNFDYERTERQRRVLFAVFDKIKSAPITRYPELVNKLAPYVETSLSNTEMISLGSKVVLYGKNGIKETRCPYDEFKQDTEIKGVFYLKWDRDKNIEKLHRFIYTN
ncbi:LCP family protein [Clostridium polynesiense]|uniref:LCP family protein n=1 Tax=Clostridium polynesiense TaxID=1325933 RepID=UPI0006940AA2|nr:LCP family protein [Clostridium polynesiense]